MAGLVKPLSLKSDFPALHHPNIPSHISSTKVNSSLPSETNNLPKKQGKRG